MITVAFHKPYGVLSRFTPDGSDWKTLAGFDLPKHTFPIGRLDADSEGLLLLSSDKQLVDRVLHPRREIWKTYWVQVERIPDTHALEVLAQGVKLRDGQTRPARALRIDPPPVGPRDPPIRYRKSVPDCWLELQISEGKNRQVRRMTAAVGHPTLRLVRAAIGGLRLGELAPGAFRMLEPADEKALFGA